MPEHAEITRIALERYAPAAVSETIAQTVASIRGATRWALPLCDHASVPFLAIPLNSPVLTASASCIPYTALPALAGDHSNDTDGLRSLFEMEESRWPLASRTVGALVLGAGVTEWSLFRDAAGETYQRLYVEAPSTGTQYTQLDGKGLDGRLFTRDLDARLQIVDPGYSSRAAGAKTHFQDAVTSIDDLMDHLVRVGNADNALAQMLSHHARSLQLALAARGDLTAGGSENRTQALLEHAFALHFLEDAFAAGHIATEPAVNRPVGRLQRHDYMNRIGLAATRALAVTTCNRSAPSPDMPTCWTAYGDGYMNADNMPLVADAVARAQLEFAMALDGGLPEKLVVGLQCKPVDRIDLDPRSPPDWNDLPADDRCDLTRAARLLDPAPSWTRDVQGPAPMTWGVAAAIVAHARIALSSLRGMAPLSRASCGSDAGSQPGIMTGEVLGAPLDPCVDAVRPPDGPLTPLRARAAQACPDRIDATQGLVSRAPRWGSVDVSLWRPLLVAWPTAQADVRTLRGKDSFGYGVAYQIAYGATAMVGDENGTVPSAVGLGLAGGIAYRADSVFPGRSNRAVLELNLGLGVSELNAVPGTRLALIGFGEVRGPLLSLGVWALAGLTTKSSDVVGVMSKNWGFGVFGGRAYVVMPATIPASSPGGTFMGGDLEVFYVSLGAPDSVREAAVGVDVDPELRVRLGWLRPGAAAQPGPLGNYGPAVLLELARGYSWFF